MGRGVTPAQLHRLAKAAGIEPEAVASPARPRREGPPRRTLSDGATCELLVGDDLRPCGAPAAGYRYDWDLCAEHLRSRTGVLSSLHCRRLAPGTRA